MIARLSLRRVVVLLLIGGMSVAAESTPKMRAKQLLAARSAAEALIEGRDQMLADSEGSVAVLIEKHLHDAMLEAADIHADPKASKSVCRELIGADVERSLSALETRALESAAQHSPLPVSLEVLFESAGISREAFRGAAVDQYSKQHADNLFKQARASAVERQLRETALRVGYPPQARLDALLSGLAAEKPAEPLMRAEILKLEPTLQQEFGIDKLALLAEVRTRLSQLALQVLGGIADQVADQTKALKRAAEAPETAALVASEDIAARMLGVADQSVEQARSKPNRDAAITLYDLFACVRSLAASQSVALEKRFLASYVGSAGSPWPTDADIERSLRADVAVHRVAGESRVVLQNEFRSEAAQRVAAAYVADRGVADSVRESKAQRMVGHLADDDSCRKAFEAWLTARVSAGADSVRARIAAEQTAAVLAALAGIERLGDRTVDWLFAAECLSAFESLERAEPAMRSKEGFGVKASLGRPLLEEADALILARVNALVLPAKDAHEQQRKLIRQLASEWQEALKQDVAQGTSLSDIRKRWRAEIDTRYAAWVDSAKSLYPALFPSNSAELEKVLRQHYVSLVETVNVEVQTTEDAMDATQEVDTDQRPTEVEEKKLIVPDEEEESAASSDSAGSEDVTPMEETLMFARRAPVSIVLSDVDLNTCELRVSYGELDRQRSVQFSPDAADAAVESIVGGLDPKTLLEALSLRQPRRGFLGIGHRSPEPVDVVVVVQSRLVRYRTMVQVRERLSVLLDEVAAAEGLDLPEMEWTAASEMPAE